MHVGPAAEAKVIILVPHHRHVEEKNNAKVGAVCISLWNGLLLVSGRGVEWFTGEVHWWRAQVGLGLLQVGAGEVGADVVLVWYCQYYWCGTL